MLEQKKNIGARMIRLLDLPGAAKIENRLTLNKGLRARDHDLEAMVETFQRAALGVEDLYRFDFHVWEANEDDDPQGADESVPVPWGDDALPTWKSAGWDVSGADGKPAQMLDLVKFALAVVAAGKADRKMIDLAAEAWGNRQAEVLPPPVRPEARRQNDAFLSLGVPRRRTAA